MKNAVFWDVSSVALIRTDASEDRIASIFMARIYELGTLVTSNRSTLTIEAIRSSETSVLRRTTQVKSQKTEFFRENFKSCTANGCQS
jgi:hypothetical protein